MLKKIGIILNNFLKSCEKREIFDLLAIPFLITMSVYLFFNNNINIKDLKDFIKNFNDTVINVTSLLSAFGLASLSILVSSSSGNIDLAKQKYTKRVDRCNKSITYYKLLVLRNFYSLFLQLTLLFISIINKFIIINDNTINISIMHKFVIEINSNITILYLEFYLLLCAIFAQVFVINSIYFLFISSKK